MIKKELIDYLSDKLNTKKEDLIEKDLILHCLLNELENKEYFRNNFVFKGGTCLIKCYFGYYRFSEDIDFTWLNQKEFVKKSQKYIRKNISEKIRKVMDILQKAAEKLDMDFRREKSNQKYVEFGGSNKFVTFKIWYHSVILNMPSFIKIQVNFLELFMFPVKGARCKNILEGIETNELRFLFSEYADLLLKKPFVKAYDIREIAIEKIRAIITRRSIKARDFVDLFLISKRKHISIRNLKQGILLKTRFMLRYEKYIQNLKDFHLEKFIPGEENKILLEPIDEGFNLFVRDIIIFLNELVEELLAAMKKP